jgi:hypothetical protein
MFFELTAVKILSIDSAICSEINPLIVSCPSEEKAATGTGIVTGFIVYVIATILGLDFIFKTVPLLYSAIKIAGIIYLLWMAWNAVKLGSESVFEPHDVPHHTLKKLFNRNLKGNSRKGF